MSLFKIQNWFYLVLVIKNNEASTEGIDNNGANIGKRKSKTRKEILDSIIIPLEENYDKWEQKDVLIWIKYILLKNGINNKIIKRFLIEFSKKCITGSMLKQFKNNETLIDSLIKQFSIDNQAFGIWLVLRASILGIGDQKETLK